MWKSADGTEWSDWEKQPNGSSWCHRVDENGRVVERMGYYCPYIPQAVIDQCNGFKPAIGFKTRYGMVNFDKPEQQRDDGYYRVGPEEEKMEIEINGTAHTVDKARLSYEEIVALAGKTGHPTVTYSWRGPGDIHRAGTLYTGRFVDAADGMNFCCVHTGNA